MSIGAYPRSVARMTSPAIHRHRPTAAARPSTRTWSRAPRASSSSTRRCTVPGGRALRERADALGKPLLGVVVTHAHPDHYGGLVELRRGLDVPVFATARRAST